MKIGMNAIKQKEASNEYDKLKKKNWNEYDEAEKSFKWMW